MPCLCLRAGAAATAACLPGLCPSACLPPACARPDCPPACQQSSPVAGSQRDALHKFSVGQTVYLWHGINDYLNVQEQISDAEVLGVPRDSKSVVGLDLVGRCLLYLRQARKFGIPCDTTFKALRTNAMKEEVCAVVCVCARVCVRASVCCVRARVLVCV